MRAVFLDTVGLLALWDIRDQWHSQAESAFSNLIKTEVRFYTTELVFAECANAASRSNFRDSVVDMRHGMASAGGILQVTDLELAEAWEQYRKESAGQPGIVDLLSFAVMRRFNLVDAFTNDRHFKAAGFATLF